MRRTATAAGLAAGVVFSAGAAAQAPCTGTELLDGQSYSVSAAANERQDFYVNVPAGQTSLNVTLTASSGDPNLYVNFGTAPALSVSDDCYSINTSGNEYCSFANPQQGCWYVATYAASNMAYSNDMLQADYANTAGGGTYGGGTAGGYNSGGGGYGGGIPLPTLLLLGLIGLLGLSPRKP